MKTIIAIMFMCYSLFAVQIGTLDVSWAEPVDSYIVGHRLYYALESETIDIATTPYIEIPTPTNSCNLCTLPLEVNSNIRIALMAVTANCQGSPLSAEKVLFLGNAEPTAPTWND